MSVNLTQLKIEPITMEAGQIKNAAIIKWHAHNQIIDQGV